jgi:multiple sugar transport system substrate-binding protein
MSSNKDYRLISRRKFLTTTATAIGGLALAACGSGGGDGGSAAAGRGGTARLKWSTWGNPGELQRFQEFTQDFNSKHPNIQMEMIAIPNAEYDSKMLTQMIGGTAPEVFYAGDQFIARLSAEQAILELGPLLAGPDSKSKPEDFFEGLWGAAKTEDGKIYGVPVDCNPMVLWYNKKLLQDAGVADMPGDLYDQGKWNRDAFQQMVDKVAAADKRGYILDMWWGHIYSWITTNGGKVYDFDNKRFVAHEDPKSVEAVKWMYDNLQAKKFAYQGALGEGQGADAMFMSQQAAFVGAGRWLLPVFKQNEGLEFDIAPWPANTGNKIEPAGIPTANIVINANAADQKAAFTFLTEYVSADGQIFRLQGGGNAVPSIKGADEVVKEGNVPEHAQVFLDAREVGYALWPIQASIAGLGTDIEEAWDKLFLKGGDPKAALTQIGEMVNEELKA